MQTDSSARPLSLVLCFALIASIVSVIGIVSPAAAGAATTCEAEPNHNLDAARKNFEDECGRAWNGGGDSPDTCDYRDEGFHCSGPETSGGDAPDAVTTPEVEVAPGVDHLDLQVWRSEGSVRVAWNVYANKPKGDGYQVVAIQYHEESGQIAESIYYTGKTSMSFPDEAGGWTYHFVAFAVEDGRIRGGTHIASPSEGCVALCDREELASKIAEWNSALSQRSGGILNFVARFWRGLKGDATGGPPLPDLDDIAASTGGDAVAQDIVQQELADGATVVSQTPSSHGAGTVTQLSNGVVVTSHNNGIGKPATVHVERPAEVDLNVTTTVNEYHTVGATGMTPEIESTIEVVKIETHNINTGLWETTMTTTTKVDKYGKRVHVSRDCEGICPGDPVTGSPGNGTTGGDGLGVVDGNGTGTAGIDGASGTQSGPAPGTEPDTTSTDATGVPGLPGSPSGPAVSSPQHQSSQDDPKPDKPDKPDRPDTENPHTK